MLDAEESSTFDDTMRDDPALHSATMEMDRLSAAIASTLAQPVEPKPGQLERLQSRLGLIPTHRTHFRAAVAGWTVAAVLGTLLTLHLTGSIGQRGSPSPIASTTPLRVATSTPETPPAVKDMAGETPIKVETKRLNQEIDVLRDNLEKIQNRDRAIFEAVPGTALPIVMAMSPPGIALEDSAPVTRIDEHSPLTTLLGDALTTLTGAIANDSAAGQVGAHTSLPDHPAAIPIYDAARDAGTLVVSNLPPAAANQVYNLWVTTQASDKPVFVGSLPENCAAGTNPFDFSLGTSGILPSGFVITRDLQGAPASPTETNTVLRGPPTPSR